MLAFCSAAKRRNLCRSRLVVDTIFEHEYSAGNFHDTVDYRVSGLEGAFPLVD